MLSSIFLKRSVSHNVILFVLTVFQLFATIWARIFNKIQYHNYLGFEPADAQFYHDIGTRFSDSSFSVYDMFIFESNSIAVDDWGFCSIISFIYSLFGINIGMQLLALCNVLFIIVGAHFCINYLDILQMIIVLIQYVFMGNNALFRIYFKCRA